MEQRAQSILISGAASGIGLATARTFAAQGWLVGALDRDTTGLDRLAAELGDQVWTRTLDITDRDAVLAAVAAYGRTTGGRLDILHANAGIDAKGPFADMAWDRVRAVVEVNLLGTMSLIHAALPLLRATPGSLVLATASASAIFGQAGMAVYSATKHAVRGLIEALSVELAQTGDHESVRAATMIPGIVDTGMLAPEHKAMLPATGPFRVIDAQAVADLAWSAYAGTGLHYFIPSEFAPLAAAAAAEPEKTRDHRLAGNIG